MFMSAVCKEKSFWFLHSVALLESHFVAMFSHAYTGYKVPLLSLNTERTSLFAHSDDLFLIWAIVDECGCEKQVEVARLMAYFSRTAFFLQQIDWLTVAQNLVCLLVPIIVNIVNSCYDSLMQAIA